MEILTHAFGPVEIDETQVITLTRPMPGFPEHRRFVVLHPDPEMPFQWFQSVDSPDVCFLITDPRPFFPDYRVEARESDLADLEITNPDQAAVGVILNLSEGIEGATANLLAPIVFNVEKKRARQVVLEGSGFALRAPLIVPEKEASQAGG